VEERNRPRVKMMQREVRLNVNNYKTTREKQKQFVGRRNGFIKQKFWNDWKKEKGIMKY
jgi:hypothetical protein